MEIIRFHAEWCGPCKAMQPMFDRVIKDSKYSALNIKDVDVDEDNDELTSKYKIRNVPTIIAVDENGEILDKIVGSVVENDLRAFLDKFIA